MFRLVVSVVQQKQWGLLNGYLLKTRLVEDLKKSRKHQCFKKPTFLLTLNILAEWHVLNGGHENFNHIAFSDKIQLFFVIFVFFSLKSFLFFAQY